MPFLPPRHSSSVPIWSLPFTSRKRPTMARLQKRLGPLLIYRLWYNRCLSPYRTMHTLTRPLGVIYQRAVSFVWKWSDWLQSHFCQSHLLFDLSLSTEKLLHTHTHTASTLGRGGRGAYCLCCRWIDTSTGSSHFTMTGIRWHEICCCSIFSRNIHQLYRKYSLSANPQRKLPLL